MKRKHALPFGAELLSQGGARFRLWAPKAESVELHLSASDRAIRMAARKEGWFEVEIEARAGTQYRFRIDREHEVPDPASRFQPGGVHVVAFARRLGDHWLIVAVPRLCAELLEYQRHLPCGSEIWRETKVELPEAAPVRFHNPLTGDPVECNPLRSFPASELFGKFPLALLVTSS